MMKQIVYLLLTVAFAPLANAFVPFQARPSMTVSTSSSLEMGLFDGIMKALTNEGGLSNAFGNEQFSAPPEGLRATARHILVKTNDDANMLLEKLESGSSFGNLAKEFSSCPSGSQKGGSLGSFQPGTMVAAFDDVIFNPDTAVGVVVGPVLTQFGYHLIVVDKRTGM